MPKQISLEKFDHTKIGDPLQIGDRSVRAVARISGFKSAPPKAGADSAVGERSTRGRRRGHRRVGPGSGVAAAGFVKVSPVEFLIRDGDGEPSKVAVRDPGAEAIRGLARVAVGVAAAAIVVSVVASLVRGLRS